MHSQLIPGRSISFDNPAQIINMGGPWVGTLMIDGKIIADNVVIDNLYFAPGTQKLYFVRYHHVSKWQNDNYFLLYFVDTAANRIFMYDLKFDRVFIDTVLDNYELTYYDAFHNKNEEKVRKVNLSTIKCIQTLLL